MDVAGHDIPQVLLSSREENGVAVIQLNRPLKRNALSQDLIDKLTKMLREMNRDPAIRVVVLTGVDQSPFCGR